jgi:predicted nucleic acid-binding protein
VKRVLLDTNVIASFLTDRNASQQAKAAALFEDAQGRHVEIVVPQIVLAELVYVLQNLYGVSREETAATLRDLLALPGLQTTDALSWTRVFELWPEIVPDFADAALVAICEGARLDAIATFDAALRRRLPRLRLASYW